MSSFKNFAPMLSSLQDQADGKGTIAGSAIEDFLSIAGYENPGGGGGDFSTAEVTVNNSIGGILITVPAIYNEIAVPFITDAPSFTVILYKGTAVMGGNPSIGSVGGDITYVEDDDIYLITGDCTITLLD